MNITQMMFWAKIGHAHRDFSILFINILKSKEATDQCFQYIFEKDVGFWEITVLRQSVASILLRLGIKQS